jgi:hypothetical protein
MRTSIGSNGRQPIHLCTGQLGTAPRPFGSHGVRTAEWTQFGYWFLLDHPGSPSLRRIKRPRGGSGVAGLHCRARVRSAFRGGREQNAPTEHRASASRCEPRSTARRLPRGSLSADSGRRRGEARRRSVRLSAGVWGYPALRATPSWVTLETPIGRSVTRLPVDRLAHQIGVPVVSRVLLDHVHQDPPQ